MGGNIAPVQFKNERVTGAALRASWFWPTLAGFPGKWGIFSGAGYSKLTPDCLGLQWNGHSTTFCTLTFQLLGGNIALVHFKNERVTGTALRASWFWPILARFPGIWGIFSGIGNSKLTRDGLGFRWNGERRNIWTHGFGPEARKWAFKKFCSLNLTENQGHHELV